MTVRNILVVTTEAIDEAVVRSRVLRDVEGQVHVHIVAPASHLSAAQRLANDEDEARSEAKRVAGRSERAFDGVASVDSEVGDTDPQLAVEDALRTFPADEIVVVTGGAESDLLGGLDSERARSHFGLPVRTITLAPAADDRSRLEEAMRELARGRRDSTPFVAFFGVNALLLALAALISLLVLLVLWLA